MTGPVIMLDDAKAWLRVDSADEDTLIQGMIDTATAEALHLADALDQDAETIPDGIKTAILLHVAALYDKREDGTIPPASTALARRHRVWDI